MRHLPVSFAVDTEETAVDDALKAQPVAVTGIYWQGMKGEEVSRLTVCGEQKGGGGRTVSRVSPQVDPQAGHLGPGMLELLWTDSGSNYGELKRDRCTRVRVCMCVCAHMCVWLKTKGGKRGQKKLDYDTTQLRIMHLHITDKTN